MAGELTEEMNLGIGFNAPTVTPPGFVFGSDLTDAERVAAQAIAGSVQLGAVFVNTASGLVGNVVNAANNAFVKPVTANLDDLNTDNIVGSVADVTSFIESQETDVKSKFDTLMADLDSDVVDFMSKIEQPQNKTDTLIDGLGDIIDQLAQDDDTADIEAAYAAGALAIDGAIANFDQSANEFVAVKAQFDEGLTDFAAVQAAYDAVIDAYNTAADRFDTVIDAYGDAISGYDGVIDRMTTVSDRFNDLDADYAAVQSRFDEAATEADAAADSIRDAVNEMRGFINSLVNALSSSGITAGLDALDAMVTALQGAYTSEINLRGQMIWELGRNRLLREADRETQIAYERAASRGFSMPSIVSAGAVDRANMIYADKLADFAKDKVVEEITRQRDSLQFAIKLAAETRVQVVNARIAAEQFVTDAKLRGFDSMIRSSASLAEAVRVRIEAAKAAIDGINAKRQGIEAQMQAAIAQQKAVDAKVSGVDAQLKGAQAGLAAVDGKLRGADAKLKGAEAKLQGAQAMLEGAKAGLEVGRAKLQGADAKIKIGDAKARLKEVVLNIRNALIGATSQAINAMGSYINSQVQVLQAKTQPRTQFFQSYTQLAGVLSNLLTARYQAAQVVVNAEISKVSTNNQNAVEAANATNRAAEAVIQLLSELGSQYCSTASSALSSVNSIGSFGSQEITSGD